MIKDRTYTHRIYIISQKTLASVKILKWSNYPMKTSQQIVFLSVLSKVMKWCDRVDMILFVIGTDYL